VFLNDAGIPAEGSCEVRKHRNRKCWLSFVEIPMILAREESKRGDGYVIQKNQLRSFYVVALVNPW
jgi:hypothetical protein